VGSWYYGTVNLPVIDPIHPWGKKCVMDVKVKANRWFKTELQPLNICIVAETKHRKACKIKSWLVLAYFWLVDKVAQISWGGASVRPKTIKENAWSLIGKKNPSVGDVWIFSETTQLPSIANYAKSNWNANLTPMWKPL